MENLKNLPTDILLDITARLPIESILNCKLVCKLGRYLVSDNPSFYRLHLSHLNQSSDSGKLSFLVLEGMSKQLHYFEYDEKLDKTLIRRINFTPTFPFSCEVLGSINGLICLYGYDGLTACICNPVTRENVMLPSIKTDCDIVNVAVYTLGSSNGWKNVGMLESEFCDLFFHHGVFVNGALHWMDKRGGMVYVFDLAEEKFREPISPPTFPPGRMWQHYTLALGVLDGVLYFSIRYDCQITGCPCSYIWLLKKQVGNESLGWSKKFLNLRREPLAFTKRGGVLCFDDSSLEIYDPILSASRKLVGFSAFTQIIPHKNTFASLKELGVEDINLMESAN
ncbi:F-box protein At2g40925-like [Papaver somniferum]|uniref:F-box protein At2g40925-like n=1 Tax=Papaver somniferum TaxID=3469 RepID=UPI000E701F74|nr:F-box protein At2g40925-like [Papaver somniferum]